MLSRQGIDCSTDIQIDCQCMVHAFKASATGCSKHFVALPLQVPLMQCTSQLLQCPPQWMHMTVILELLLSKMLMTSQPSLAETMHKHTYAHNIAMNYQILSGAHVLSNRIAQMHACCTHSLRTFQVVANDRISFAECCLAFPFPLMLLLCD